MPNLLQETIYETKNIYPKVDMNKKVEYFIDIGWVTLNFFDNPSVNLFDP